MADLQPHVPKAIENAFGDGLAPRGLLVGKQEKEIDVGAGCEQAAPVAAGRDHRHALGIRRDGGAIEPHRQVVQQPDDLILHRADLFGAGAPVAIAQKLLLGGAAAFREHAFQPLRHSGAQFALAARMFIGKVRKLCGERVRIDERAALRRLIGGRKHGCPDSRASACCHARRRQDEPGSVLPNLGNFFYDSAAESKFILVDAFQ